MQTGLRFFFLSQSTESFQTDRIFFEGTIRFIALFFWLPVRADLVGSCPNFNSANAVRNEDYFRHCLNDIFCGLDSTELTVLDPRVQNDSNWRTGACWNTPRNHVNAGGQNSIGHVMLCHAYALSFSLTRGQTVTII